MNTKLLYNGTTYEFNYFQGRNYESNETYPCYGVYINGGLDTDYHLEHCIITSGRGDKKYGWVLYWLSTNTEIIINDFSLNEIVRVIDWINNNKTKVRE